MSPNTHVNAWIESFLKGHYNEIVIVSLPLSVVLMFWLISVYTNSNEQLSLKWFVCVFAVVPVRKVHALNITWALPPQEKYYR